MATNLTMAELLKMPPADLRREIAQQRASIAKQRLGIELQKEKNAGKYREDKRGLARMLTALRQQETAPAAPASKQRTAKTSSPARA